MLHLPLQLDVVIVPRRTSRTTTTVLPIQLGRNRINNSLNIYSQERQPNERTTTQSTSTHQPTCPPALPRTLPLPFPQSTPSHPPQHPKPLSYPHPQSSPRARPGLSTAHSTHKQRRTGYSTSRSVSGATYPQLRIFRPPLSCVRFRPRTASLCHW